MWIDVSVIAAFEKYLATGYYPIYKETGSDYGMQLRQMVSTIIETDLPAAYKLEYATLIKLKHLMAIIAHTVPFTINGDFLIDDKYTIEVGGKGKSFSQIKDVPDSYLALGDMEYGHLNKIPLWLFGFLY